MSSDCPADKQEGKEDLSVPFRGQDQDVLTKHEYEIARLWVSGYVLAM